MNIFLFSLSTPVAFLIGILLTRVAMETTLLEGNCSKKPGDSNPRTHDYKTVTLPNTPRRSPTVVLLTVSQ